MDNFMDKLAQKFNAGELIKANTQAETMEMQRMRDQIQQYDNCLQEMRKLTLKNTELADYIQKLTSDSISRVHLEERNSEEQITLTAKEIEKQSALIDDKMSELKEILENNRKDSENRFIQADDFVHKENVKVYRNVQAAMVEELKAQTEALNMQTESIKRKLTGIKPLIIITLIFGVANLAAFVLNILGYLNF